MSDSHASPGTHGADDHAPEPVDFTHPIIWTIGLLAISAFLVWLFFHFMGSGRITARGEPNVALEVGAKGEVEPDHAKLIADRTPEVIERGQMIYAKNCVSCHGPHGDTNTSGNSANPPRNFHKDEFKNPLGGGPYALYVVLSKGYGGMPAFPGLSPADRYAVVHFVRESWVKVDNANCYLENDLEAVIPTIPKAGEAGSGGPKYPPNEQPAPAMLNPLLQITADQATEQEHGARAWLAAADRDADPAVAPDLKRLEAMVEHRQRLSLVLREAARAGDQDRFLAVLTAADAPAVNSAEFSVMPADRLSALFAHLRKAAAAEGSR